MPLLLVPDNSGICPAIVSSVCLTSWSCVLILLLTKKYKSIVLILKMEMTSPPNPPGSNLLVKVDLLMKLELLKIEKRIIK